jgi:hypothetical protein
MELQIISNNEFRISNTEVFLHYSTLDIRCSIFKSIFVHHLGALGGKVYPFAIRMPISA